MKNKHKILIVDDEEGVREALKLILEDYYELVLCNEGPRTVEILENTPDVQLVILDIKMPRQNGLEVLKDIKAKFPDMKVIIATGYKSIETATEAVRLGATGYAVKPFQSEEILATVRNHFK